VSLVGLSIAEVKSQPKGSKATTTFAQSQLFPQLLFHSPQLTTVFFQKSQLNQTHQHH